MMRVTVLKAPKAGGVSAIVRYLDPGAPERSGPGRYYTGTPDPPGRWWGSGRDAVGLAGEVQPEQLERMLEARHPLDGRRLGRGFGESSARAYDATFSAPKSVSLLWALSPDENVRGEVVAAHDAAVEATLGLARGARLCDPPGPVSPRDRPDHLPSGSPTAPRPASATGWRPAATSRSRPTGA